MSGYGAGIFGKYRGIFHHALFQAYALAVFQVYRRNNQHF
jgi:hypothetical protein